MGPPGSIRPVWVGNASRLGNELINTDTAKTEASEAVLPLPDVCPTALRLRRQVQEAAEKAAGEMDRFGFRVHAPRRDSDRATELQPGVQSAVRAGGSLHSRT